MTKREKRLDAMRRNPKNMRPDDLDAVMRAAGCAVEHEGGSHKIYRHSGRQISVPQRKLFLLPEYVKQAVAILDELETLAEIEADEEKEEE